MRLVSCEVGGATGCGPVEAGLTPSDFPLTKTPMMAAAMTPPEVISAAITVLSMNSLCIIVATRSSYPRELADNNLKHGQKT